MAKEYKAGDRYYLPVCVNEIDSGYLYPVRIAFNNGDGNNEGHNAIKNEPDLLLTVTEIAENIAGRRCVECLPMYNEVVAERDNLKADLTTQKNVNEELKAKIAELTEWYEEANKTASEAAEANDELKAKIADLRNRVGEQLAQIQDLNAEVHFHKEFGEGLDKQQKELQARYDELDSVNKEQAEKIRKLDAHNVYLKGLLSAKKKMRIVLNNGSMYDVEVGDKVHTVYDMNNNLFFVKTEGGTVTSFLIGKEPGNIAGWYLA